MNASAADTILEVSGLSKLYSRSPLEHQRRLMRHIVNTLVGRPLETEKSQAKEFWAVDDVNFELRRGQALGIIGFNGAGKTTLLRLLLGQLLPDKGEIRIHGTFAGMIDLTAGFQINLSGRHNIYLRSAMLGRSQSQVAASVDAIIAFTELGDAIDAPVSTYSSGMMMRLAFAITIFMDPNLLIIDEVLSVGDFKFRQKCLARIREMREKSAFVLVSHSMQDISRFCDEVIVLENGRIAFKGAPDEAIRFYQNGKMNDGTSKPTKEKQPEHYLGDFIHNRAVIADVSHFWCDEAGNPVETVACGEPIWLRVKFTLLTDTKNLIIGVPIWNDAGLLVSALNSEQAGHIISGQHGERCEVIIKIPEARFVPRRYKSVVAIVDGPEFLYRQENMELVVLPGNLTKFWGEIVTNQEWTTQENTAEPSEKSEPARSQLASGTK